MSGFKMDVDLKLKASWRIPRAHFVILSFAVLFLKFRFLIAGTEQISKITGQIQLPESYKDPRVEGINFKFGFPGFILRSAIEIVCKFGLLISSGLL